MYNDPFDPGIPQYMTATSIYDGLLSLTRSEEMCIIGQMFPNVSYDNQDYYYYEKGYTLYERFEEMSGYGEKMWVMELAAFQVDQDARMNHTFIHDYVYDAIINTDLARRLGFKKIFVEHMTHGISNKQYSEIIEAYACELQELNRFDYCDMIRAYLRAVEACGWEFQGNPYDFYNGFTYALYDKMMSLRLPKEKQLIIECRAILNSYDDFILGLRMNQSLYESLEQQYERQAAQLKASYEEKVKLLYAIAASKGIVFDPGEELVLLRDCDLPKEKEDV